MTGAAFRPIFATPHPLLIAGIREVLTAAGITTDPQVVEPEALGRVLDQAERCLVILDAQALPKSETLGELCRRHPHSSFVLWVTRPTAEMLTVALECGVHGLLSTKLPLEEASQALVRICRGERIFRYDSHPGPMATAKPVELTARERHVLMVLAEGASNAAIAGLLHTTESNVKVCLSRMFRKTGTRNRRELLEFSRWATMAAEERGAADSFDEDWMLESQ